VLALEHSGPAIYSIVDDDPAPVREWLSVLANALGPKPPRHTPTWLARLFAGRASNAKAKRDSAGPPLPDMAPRLPGDLLGDRNRRPAGRQGCPGCPPRAI
jgi:nucleoside-diphosphate-sugar epimerase